MVEAECKPIWESEGGNSGKSVTNPLLSSILSTETASRNDVSMTSQCHPITFCNTVKTKLHILQ